MTTQVMGGAALHFGRIAEMMTGEGKTLASVMPAYLNALAGNGVHIVTVNDYLAQRDSEWMGQVHRHLGLDVGVILAHTGPGDRRRAYAADITYGTNTEFGFDYLRDNMAHSLEGTVQRGQSYAIVDEVDSILIDGARTPLIISGPADDASHWYAEFARLAELMRRDIHYEVDVRKRTVGVNVAGVELVEDQLGIDNLYEVANAPWSATSTTRCGPRNCSAATRTTSSPTTASSSSSTSSPAGFCPGAATTRTASGHRGQRGRRDQSREPDTGHHHTSELLPAV